MSAGQARHEHGLARMAFDDEGSMLAAQLDFVQDVGAYPTPSPLQPAFATGMLFPGPYRVPSATFTAKVMFSHKPGRSASRGPWQLESLSSKAPHDSAASQSGRAAVDLRRPDRHMLDERPYQNTTPIGT